MVQLVQSRRGRTPTLLLNLVSSVGLPEMPAIELLAHFLRGKWTNKEWIEYLGQGHGERDVQGIIDTLNGPLGMRGLRVQYQGKKKIVSGITQKPARHLWFSHAEYGNVSVQEYFLKKYNTEFPVFASDVFLFFFQLSQITALDQVVYGVITVNLCCKVCSNSIMF